MKAVYFLFSSNPGAFFLELSKLLLFWMCFLFALCLLIIMLSLLTCSFRATFSCATRACLSVCTSTLGAAYSVDLSAFFRAVDVYTETCLHYSDRDDVCHDQLFIVTYIVICFTTRHHHNRSAKVVKSVYR